MNYWIRPIDLEDGKLMPVEVSISILKGVHQRWVNVLRNMSDEDFEKDYRHPEHCLLFKLKLATAEYAWHSNHHLAHITETLKRIQ